MGISKQWILVSIFISVFFSFSASNAQSSVPACTGAKKSQLNEVCDENNPKNKYNKKINELLKQEAAPPVTGTDEASSRITAIQTKLKEYRGNITRECAAKERDLGCQNEKKNSEAARKSEKRSDTSLGNAGDLKTDAGGAAPQIPETGSAPVQNSGGPAAQAGSNDGGPKSSSDTTQTSKRQNPKGSSKNNSNPVAEKRQSPEPPPTEYARTDDPDMKPSHGSQERDTSAALGEGDQNRPQPGSPDYKNKVPYQDRVKAANSELDRRESEYVEEFGQKNGREPTAKEINDYRRSQRRDVFKEHTTTKERFDKVADGDGRRARVQKRQEMNDYIRDNPDASYEELQAQRQILNEKYKRGDGPIRGGGGNDGSGGGHAGGNPGTGHGGSGDHAGNRPPPGSQPGTGHGGGGDIGDNRPPPGSQPGTGRGDGGDNGGSGGSPNPSPQPSPNPGDIANPGTPGDSGNQAGNGNDGVGDDGQSGSGHAGNGRLSPEQRRRAQMIGQAMRQMGGKDGAGDASKNAHAYSDSPRNAAQQELHANNSAQQQKEDDVQKLGAASDKSNSADKAQATGVAGSGTGVSASGDNSARGLNAQAGSADVTVLGGMPGNGQPTHGRSAARVGSSFGSGGTGSSFGTQSEDFVVPGSEPVPMPTAPPTASQLVAMYTPPPNPVKGYREPSGLGQAVVANDPSGDLAEDSENSGDDLPDIDTSVVEVAKKKEKKSFFGSMADKLMQSLMGKEEKEVEEEPKFANAPDDELKEAPTKMELAEMDEGEEEPLDENYEDEEEAEEDVGFFGKISRWASETLRSTKWFGTDEENEQALADQEAAEFMRQDPIFEDESDVVVLDAPPSLKGKSMRELAAAARAAGSAELPSLKEKKAIVPGLNGTGVYEENPALANDKHVYGLSN